MPINKDKQAYVVFAVVGLLLAAAFTAKVALDSKPRAGADNCIGDSVANTVIVLDYSDDVPLQTRDEVQARAMAHVNNRVAVNERVSVFTVSALSKRNLVPVVTVCRPPNDGNRATAKVAFIKKHYRDSFEQPLRAALAGRANESPESPIAQALTDLSLSQYLRAPTNTLLVFSDMLENTSSFSLYRCAGADAVVSTYRQARKGAQERPHFENTNVVVNLIPRLGQSAKTVACRDRFWTWFFGDSGGAKDRAGLDVVFLPGGAAVGPSALNGSQP
jgi:hypothetical protein